MADTTKVIESNQCPNLFWKLAPKHPDNFKMLHSYNLCLTESDKWETNLGRRKGQDISNYQQKYWFGWKKNIDPCHNFLIL